MKYQKRTASSRRIAKCLGTLCLFLLAVQGSALAFPPGESRSRALPAIELVLKHLEPDSATSTERLRAVLTGREYLLEYLPHEALRSVRVGHSWVEFEFDFRGRKTRKVETPSSELVVFCPRKGGRIRHVKTERHCLVIRDHVRFDLDGTHIAGVRHGDIRVKKGWFSFDVRLHTESRPVEVVRDGDGREVLVTDEAGKPLRRDGELVRRTATEWFVLKAGGVTAEVPLG